MDLLQLEGLINLTGFIILTLILVGSVIFSLQTISMRKKSDDLLSFRFYKIIFLFLELTDGSLIICLPLGISAFLISFFVFISNNHLIDDWYILLFLWAILSVIASYLLTKFWKKDH